MNEGVDRSHADCTGKVLNFPATTAAARLAAADDSVPTATARGKMKNESGCGVVNAGVPVSHDC